MRYGKNKRDQIEHLKAMISGEVDAAPKPVCYWIFRTSADYITTDNDTGEIIPVGTLQQYFDTTVKDRYKMYNVIAIHLKPSNCKPDIETLPYTPVAWHEVKDYGTHESEAIFILKENGNFLEVLGHRKFAGRA